MKYIDRRAIGIELFFADKSQITSRLNDYSAEEIIERLDSAPYRVRYSIGRLVGDSLSELLRFGRPTARLVPDNVVKLANAASVPELFCHGQLKDFFVWLKDLQLENERSRISWLASLRDTASRLDAECGGFLVAFSSLINQRVVVKSENGGLLMTVAEREWGKASLFFPDCSHISNHPTPLMGFLFWLEGDALEDGQFQFSLLIDTEFSSSDYTNRLLEDDNWTTLRFRCAKPELRFEQYDYIGRMCKNGTSRVELCERGCELLLSKSAIMGGEALSPEEREIIPLCKLMHSVNGLMDGCSDSEETTFRSMAFEALDNRYALDGIRKLFTDCGCAKLLTHFDLAIERHQAEDFDGCIKELRRMGAAYDGLISCGEARMLMYQLERRFLSLYRDRRLCGWQDCAEELVRLRVCGAIEPALDRMNFEGEFPHYSRRADDSVQYISVIIAPLSDRPKHGVAPYSVTLAAARTSGAGLKSSCVPAAAANALDCCEESSEVSDYAELCSEADGRVLEISVDIFAPGGPAVCKDESGELAHCLALVENELRGKGLPRKYRRARMHAARSTHPFLRALADKLHIALITTIALIGAYILWGKSMPIPAGTRPASIALAAAGIGILSALIPGAVSYIRKSRHLWRF